MSRIEGTDPSYLPGNTLEALTARVRKLESQVSSLQGGPQIPVETSAPTDAPPDGYPRADSSANRLWLRVGGSWRYVALT